MVQALLGGACGTGIDVWSLGCLLAEVALQRPLFPVATTAELTHQVTSHNVTLALLHVVWWLPDVNACEDWKTYVTRAMSVGLPSRPGRHTYAPRTINTYTRKRSATSLCWAAAELQLTGSAHLWF